MFIQSIVITCWALASSIIASPLGLTLNTASLNLKNTFLMNLCPKDPLAAMEITKFNSSKNANRFGCVRNDPTKKCPDGQQKKRFHAGIDLVASVGTAVYSADDGEVFATGSSPTLGNYVLIKKNKIFYMYAHLKEVPSVSGRVKMHDVIGKSGESATVGEPHVHFEVRKQANNEEYNKMEMLDPEPFLGTKFDNNGNTIPNTCN